MGFINCKHLLSQASCVCCWNTLSSDSLYICHIFSPFRDLSVVVLCALIGFYPWLWLYVKTFLKIGKRKRGEMIHSINWTFLQNVASFCDLYLIFSMLNRFLRNSWCLCCRWLGLLTNLQVHHLPSKGMLLSYQFKWNNNNLLHFRVT